MSLNNTAGFKAGYSEGHSIFRIPVFSFQLCHLQFAGWSLLLVPKQLPGIETWNADTTSNGRSVSSQVLTVSGRKPFSKSPPANFLSGLIGQSCPHPRHTQEEERSFKGWLNPIKMALLKARLGAHFLHSACSRGQLRNLLRLSLSVKFTD